MAGKLRLRHIRLRNWMNFVVAEVDVPDRLFLVGPNASGKSNFLKALLFLRDVAVAGGGLQSAVRARGGLRAIRSLAARREPDIEIAVRVGADADVPPWEYELVFGDGHGNGVGRGKAVVKRERVVVEGEEVLLRPTREDEKDPELLTQTHLEQVAANRAFRPLAELFGSIQYLHVVPQLIRDPDRSVGIRDDPYGGDFLERIARTPARTRDARLRRICEALRVAVPQLEEIELRRDERGTPHLEGRFRHWRRHGAWQREEQLSDGTLRLLGLLWGLMDGTGPLLLEEPELSLHPAIVRVLPQMFVRVQRQGGRQVLVSTHSPDLLQDEGIGLHEVLLLRPGKEGTEVQPASELEEVRALLEGGMPLGEAVLPFAQPEDARRIARALSGR